MVMTRHNPPWEEPLVRPWRTISGRPQRDSGPPSSGLGGSTVNTVYGGDRALLTSTRDVVSRWGERLGVPPEELEEVARDRDVWVSLLKVLPCDPIPGEAADDGWMEILILMFVVTLNPWSNTLQVILLISHNL